MHSALTNACGHVTAETTECHRHAWENASGGLKKFPFNVVEASVMLTWWKYNTKAFYKKQVL